jgi:NAD dependent epimerase/dehydratase family enzyme
VLRLVLGELADALILGGQRVVPARAQALGYEFKYPTLEPALRAIYTA